MCIEENGTNNQGQGIHSLQFDSCKLIKTHSVLQSWCLTYNQTNFFIEPINGERDDVQNLSRSKQPYHLWVGYPLEECAGS